MDNEVLYKYRSWRLPYHADTLLKRQLHFSSPKDMNDPFDLKIPPNFSLLNTDEQMMLYFNDGISKFTPQQVEQLGGVEQLKKKMFDRFKLELPKTQRDYETNYFSTLENHFGVICLSRVWDSVLMWSHYSDNHFGFCMGFDKTQLLKSCQFGSQGAVQYDHFPQIHPLSLNDLRTIVQQSYFKAPGWSYEREFRFVKLEYPNELSQNDRIYIYPESCLKEIILGLRISDKDKMEISRFASEHEIPLYQMVKAPLSFDMDRQLI